MLPILLSVFAVSFAGAIVPGPILVVTLAKSYKSPWAGFQITLDTYSHVVPGLQQSAAETFDSIVLHSTTQETCFRISLVPH